MWLLGPDLLCSFPAGLVAMLLPTNDGPTILDKLGRFVRTCLPGPDLLATLPVELLVCRFGGARFGVTFLALLAFVGDEKAGLDAGDMAVLLSTIPCLVSTTIVGLMLDASFKDGTCSFLESAGAVDPGTISHEPIIPATVGFFRSEDLTGCRLGISATSGEGMASLL